MNEFSQSPHLILLPAVDVSGGKAVRLTQGESGTETAYGDPIEAAEEWMRQGAQWLHLVDLDAAFGRGDNRAVIRKVVKAVGKKVNVELSGEFETMSPSKTLSPRAQFASTSEPRRWKTPSGPPT